MSSIPQRSAIDSFTNAASAAIGEGDPRELRRLADQCRAYLRTYPGEPFFKVFEVLFEKSANLLATTEICRFLKDNPKAYQILLAIARVSSAKSASSICSSAKVGREVLKRNMSRLISLGCVSQEVADSLGIVRYSTTEKGKESLMIFQPDL